MQKKILLIIDDSKVSRMMLTALLKDHNPDLGLIEAEHAEDAKEKIRGKTIDYFSVDLNMPGVNGFEFIEMVRPDYPNAKFALLTANIQDSTHEKCKSLGISCINKPITEETASQLMAYFND